MFVAWRISLPVDIRPTVAGRALEIRLTYWGSSLPRLHFKGKVLVANNHLAVPFHELLPVRETGLNEKANLHDNLIVHGDNLAALKSLLPTYHGKVKCVYIDPPYTEVPLGTKSEVSDYEGV